ncbi:hypothetical protein I6E68_08620 [Salinibacterium sp. NSLL150]|nr:MULTISPECIES: hypothetical protein [unclassified Salinibacterium]MBH0099198.1 hypothetical protein [Salinibacterium sp. NSLL35]MBH0101952.1 hypothetical protein [Salinibacterium sp. NSLL150]MBH0104712.1 hypothetical protein [Salinibacterium sp. NSLL16]MBH0107472.1 hypothetical protein [Salinibacterium sp. NSLL17]MBH0108751.1 hypothetical protein [Salinibacterium sp. NG22]
MDFVFTVVVIVILFYVLHRVVRSAVRDGILLADEERQSVDHHKPE